MDSILSQYFKGVTQQMRIQIDQINNLFNHNLLKGYENEAILRDFVKAFLPKRFGVGTGIVIDRDGNYSRQCDIVIYDLELYPSLFAFSASNLFPVDCVYAVIEIKTTIDKSTAEDALNNIASVRRLRYVTDAFSSLETSNNEPYLVQYKSTPPLGFVFAYNSKTQQDTTFKSWFVQADPKDVPLSPSLVCSLDFGILGYGDKDDVNIRIHHQPATGLVLEGKSFAFSRVKNGVEGEPKSDKDIEYLRANGIPPEVLWHTIDGVSYPVKRSGNDTIFIDQGKVLMNFMLTLNTMISAKQLNPSIDFGSTYLKGADRFHFSF